MYKMNQENTPGIGNLLIENNIEYIPEAHCYLKIDGQRTDVTSQRSHFSAIKKDLLEE